jgi:hypothetical protein
MLVLLHALVIERGDELLDLFDKLLRPRVGVSRSSVDGPPASATSSHSSDGACR